MINLAQVVAALAAGALLTIAVMLVFRLHGPHRGAEQAVQRQDDDREREIETAAQMIEHGFDLLQRTDEDGWPHEPDDDSHAVLPPGTVAVIRKGHLRMLVFAAPAAVLTGIGETIRQAWGDSRRQLMGQVLTGASVGVAGALFLMTPEQKDGRDEQGPYPGPTTVPTAPPVSPTGSPGPGPSVTDGPGPAAPVSSTRLSADPSALGAAPSSSAAPGPSAVVIPPPGSEPSSAAPPDTASPSSPAPGESEPTASPPATPSPQPTRAGLCIDIDLLPLLGAGICLLPSGR